MPIGLGFGELLILALPVLLVVLPGWRIVSKAGFHGAWSLLLLVPLVNLVMIFVFAFTEWPVERAASEAAMPG